MKNIEKYMNVFMNVLHNVAVFKLRLYSLNVVNYKIFVYYHQ